ncbi:MAG: class II histone deacetylase [Hyphomicrobiales bacterium]|nr:class II histone deacetylase [Hyphomicrobiales bacterium]
MSGTKTGFYFDERCMWHTAAAHALIVPVGGWVEPLAAGGHAESPESKRRFKSLLDVSGLTAQLDVRSAPMATMDDLLRVHGRAYLDEFKKLSDAGGGELGTRAPFGPGSYDIARVSAGLAMQAVDDVLSGDLDNAYALSRPPGHHCLADEAMGFCLLANIPVALEASRAKHGVEKVAVVDWDVHHGNGTQVIYYDRADTLAISIHMEGGFPPGLSAPDMTGEGAGQGANLNIPLLPGAGQAAYMAAFERLVLPKLQAFDPDLIVVACGFDANGFDPLSRTLAHSGTFADLTRLIMKAADHLCGGRLVLVHEGGYAEAVVPFCGVAVMEQLSGISTEVEDPFRALLEGRQPPDVLNDLQMQLLDEQVALAGL